jgi:hypothetical protein
MILPHRLHKSRHGKQGQRMAEHDRLSSLVLAHWSRYQPKMLRQLRQENRLPQALEATAQQMADLLYDLTMVKKMEHHQAWEMMLNEFLLPGESSSTANPSPGPHATSG